MYRLPSIVAFALTLVAVFLFVRHVAGAWSGAAAAAMLLPTQLFTVHAVDARPYALVACAVAWAAVMWQRAERGGRFVLGFGFLLAFAVSLHYYAVAVWLPFTAAELTRWRRTTTLRPSVWLALAFGLLPLAGFWPLVAAMRAEFGPHFWARPPIAGFLRAYDTLLNLSNWWGAVLWIVLAATLVAMVVRLGGAPCRPGPIGRRISARDRAAPPAASCTLPRTSPAWASWDAISLRR
jgi:mannosyltransferase